MGELFEEYGSSLRGFIARRTNVKELDGIRKLSGGTVKGMLGLPKVFKGKYHPDPYGFETYNWEITVVSLYEIVVVVEHTFQDFGILRRKIGRMKIWWRPCRKGEEEGNELVFQTPNLEHEWFNVPPPVTPERMEKIASRKLRVHYKWRICDEIVEALKYQMELRARVGLK